MNMWRIIPTCDDPMSVYTLLSMAVLVTGNGILLGLMVKWATREFKRVERCLLSHDDYIDDTAKIINQMSTDIAVTRESVENIEKSIAETKNSISTINNTLIDKLVK